MKTKEAIKAKFRWAIEEHNIDLFSDDLFYYASGYCGEQPIDVIAEIISELRREDIEQMKEGM